MNYFPDKETLTLIHCLVVIHYIYKNISFLKWFYVFYQTMLKKFSTQQRMDSLRIMKYTYCYTYSSQNLTHLTYPYLPTPPLGQDSTQGQFLNRV